MIVYVGRVKIKKIMLVFILGIVLLALASAQDEPSELGVYKTKECVNIYQLCDDCTYVTLISVTFPNSTVDDIDTNMTKNGVDFNYTWCTTETLGRYFYKVCGDKEGDFKCEVIQFHITPTGTKLTQGESTIYLILLIGVIFIFLLSLYGSIVLKLSNSRDGMGNIIKLEIAKYVKLTCMVITYLLFIWIINLLLALATNFVILQPYIGFFTVIFNILNAFVWPIFVLILIIGFLLAWRDLKLKPLLQRGLVVR
jgi:hypothetical protein